ncbi:MAG TPA: hypothetical protein VF755_10585 [Catenuloplanes sp.]
MCRVTTNGVAKNLIYNRTTRRGAAERTGFLHRELLASTTAQRDSCDTGGVAQAAGGRVTQRLCPYTACGETGRTTANHILRHFCYIAINGVDWHLTVSHVNQQNGPLTAGFVRADELAAVPAVQNDCTRPL